MEVSPQWRRRAMFGVFMIPGLALSTWVTRTPEIRDRVGASTGEMGLVLLGLSIGSMIGILSSGPLVSRFGTRPLILIGMALIPVSLVVISLGAGTGLAPVVAGGLLVFGLGMGGADVAMNVEGAAVERAVRRPSLPAMHGMYSVATVIGALVGFAATAGGVPIVVHLPAVGAVTLVALLVVQRGIPAGTGRVDVSTAGRMNPLTLLRDRTLVLIGIVVLAMAFAEGAANDWLPLIFVDGHGFSATAGAFAYAGFAAAQAAGRFASGGLLVRFGRPVMVRASAAVGALGLGLVIFADHPVLVGVSVLLWGLGVSVGFPVALSAAGDSGEHATARVSFAATIGYVAFLVGPPLLGLLGDEFGLRSAMIVVLALLGVAMAAAGAVAGRRQPT